MPQFLARIWHDRDVVYGADATRWEQAIAEHDAALSVLLSEEDGLPEQVDDLVEQVGLLRDEVYETKAPAPPTTGAHTVGQRVYNSAPTSGQPLGWVCTVAGTPGTWVGFAVLA